MKILAVIKETRYCTFSAEFASAKKLLKIGQLLSKDSKVWTNV